MKKKKQGMSWMVILCYAIVYIVWGSTFFFIEKALVSFPPFVLGAIRFGMAAGILLIYCKMKGYKLWHLPTVKNSLLTGFLLLFVDMAAIIWAEQFISSGVVSIISAATVIWFVVLDKPQWRQNFKSPTTIMGLILGFAGVLLLFMEQLLTPSSGDGHSYKLIAMVVMIIGTLAWTIGSLITKYNVAKNSTLAIDQSSSEPSVQIHILVKTAWQMITAGVSFVIAATFAGEWQRVAWLSITNEAWFAMFYLVVMGSIIAFSAYLWLLERRPATEVSTYAYINPIVALLLVYFFTAYVVSLLQVIGLIIVLLSVVLMNWSQYKDKRLFVAFKNRRFRKIWWQQQYKLNLDGLRSKLLFKPFIK